MARFLDRRISSPLTQLQVSDPGPPEVRSVTPDRTVIDLTGRGLLNSCLEANFTKNKSPAAIIFRSAIIFSREFLNATVSLEDKK